MSSTCLWQPSQDRIRNSQMHDFLMKMSARYGLPPEWEALRNWAIDDREHFWGEMLTYAGIASSAPADRVCEGGGMLDTRWFPDMRLNYAAHLLRFDEDGDAIFFENEQGQSRRVSRFELRDQVSRIAAALRADEVTAGDRVAGYLPNLPETVIAMLASASIGAVWSSCSPDFGVDAVVDRFGQIEPTVLFVADGYQYQGKTFDLAERVRQIAARLPSLERIVIVPYLNDVPGAQWHDVRPLDTHAYGTCTWQAFLSLGSDTETGHADLAFEPVPFDHPLVIMYSSGTTGVPKCIVHGHGGTLLQHAKEHLLHCDIRAGDRVFYFTTCGWMMWNWLVSALGAGAAIVLYDGSPLKLPTAPTAPAAPAGGAAGAPPAAGLADPAERLWELAGRLRVTFFGTSPKFLAACQSAGISPQDKFDLSALRTVASTGSPLSPALFEWVYRHVKDDVMLASISGGTDIISCFMLGNPLLPVYAGEIQCRGLGMDVQAWDEAGRPVVGQKGELVCCSPFPSQPVGFWNDPDGRKYRAAYFEHQWMGEGVGNREQGTGNREQDTGPENRKLKTENPVWRHGDYIEITPHGGVIVYGRSDATLNPGGVRIGTAEIYRVVEALPEVLDSLVTGRRTPDGDEEVCLFVVLREGVSFDALAPRIREAIAAAASKRHVPRHIRAVKAIPHTISGKKVELAVRQVLHGQTVQNRDALANPEALDEFVGIL